MRKSDRERKWEEIDIRNFLQESANDQQIPQSLLPQHMEERLKQKNTGQEKDKDKLLITEKAEFRKRRRINILAGGVVRLQRRHAWHLCCLRQDTISIGNLVWKMDV